MDFRFLDLPADIRLMIYEFLPTYLTHNEITIEKDNESGRLKMKTTKVKLVNIWYPTTVRLISKIIREEATPIIARTAAKRNSTLVADDSSKVSRSGPKLIVSCGDLEVIARKQGPLEAASEFLTWFLEARRTAHSVSQYVPLRGPSPGGKFGYFVEHFDLEYGEWIEAWVPQDCV
ncbi:hypothetical protein J4E89_010119 [Alternaria sp. Ai002NY15]|nr:hypothetical protein J4E89_010119 [Alternaria sp. Ai002NY15]